MATSTVSNGAPKTRNKALDPASLPMFSAFEARNFRFMLATLQDRKWMTLDEWGAHTREFPTHFKIDGTTTVKNTQPVILANDLLNATTTVTRDQRYVPGIVFHFGLDLEHGRTDFVLALSIVSIDKQADLGADHNAYPYEIEDSPFFKLNGDHLVRPDPNNDNTERKNWMDIYRKNYFDRMYVDRSDNPMHPVFEPVRRHLDVECEAFPGDEIYWLLNDNTNAAQTPTHIEVSCIARAGMDIDDYNTDYRHALVLVATKNTTPITRFLQNYDLDERYPLRDRAADLGNLCPPKCKRAPLYPR